MSIANLSYMLREKMGISEEFALSASERLMLCKNPIYLNSILNYIKTGQKAFLNKDRYNTEILMKNYGMDYLNAVLMLVWIEEEPDEALSALDEGVYEII